MKKTIFFTLLFLSMPALADNSLFDYLTTSQKALIFYPLIKNNLKDHYLSKNEGYYYLPQLKKFTFTDRPSWNLSALSAEWTMQVWYSIFTMLPGGRRPDVDISDTRYIEWTVYKNNDAVVECSALLMIVPDDFNNPDNGWLKVSIVRLTLDQGGSHEKILETPVDRMRVQRLNLNVFRQLTSEL